ncbi:unnamed protein product [Closterium sp. Yama58-4]|nr:unnamed protein product [Closterium sp. Yama58-4]
MSERSNVSATGPRANPLYGGPANPSAGNRTPSWARKSGVGGSSNRPSFSDAASSPPDSPARSARSNNGPAYYAPQYEHPGYTVETPGVNDAMLGQSPFRAPPYYVQTPAHSERPGSPMSSVPDSPAHTMSYDMRSVRSGKPGSSRVYGAPARAAAIAPLSSRINEEVDEEEQLYEPPAKEASGGRSKRSKRFWTICIVVGILALVLAAVATGIALYYVFQPDAPTYTFDYATLNEFQIVNKLADGTGLPTDQLFANVTFVFSAINPNGKYTLQGDGGLLQVGYSSIPTLMQGGLPYFALSSKNFTNFTTSVGVAMYPLYGVGPGLRQDIMAEYISMSLHAEVNSRIEMAWKIVQTHYTHVMDCSVAFNPSSSVLPRPRVSRRAHVSLTVNPRVLVLAPDEDVATRIFLESQAGPNVGVCVLSANGSISSATLRDPSGGANTTIHEGRFELLNMSGSFLPHDPADPDGRMGGLSVSLVSSNGRVVGGGVAGRLVAATPVQVILATFLHDPSNLSTPGSRPAAGQ